MEIKLDSLPKKYNIAFADHNNFTIARPLTGSEMTSFLKGVYGYPPKFKLIWDEPDHSNPSMRSKLKPAQLNQNYKNRFVNKKASSNFYKKTLSIINNRLQTVPVYVILNGRGEVVFATLHEVSSRFSSFNSQAYGPLDPRFNKMDKLGLIFFNRNDAEMHLQEIINADLHGTDKVGLSIHCIGLNSAYSLLRDLPSGIDFRFVPD